MLIQIIIGCQSVAVHEHCYVPAPLTNSNSITVSPESF